MEIKIPKVKPHIILENQITGEDLCFDLRKRWDTGLYGSYQFPIRVLGNDPLGNNRYTRKIYVFNRELADISNSNFIVASDTHNFIIE
jgi:hypothetical protein